ncbi:hypothetical protein AMS66_01005, partial [Paenibacillus xylanivorans]
MAWSLDLVQRARLERSCCFQGAQAAKGEEGAEGASLASDFNRQERWKRKSEDKRATRPYHPRSVRGAPRTGQELTASHAFSGES